MVSETERLRAAIVGCGGAGTNHASGYQSAPTAELVAVCDLDRERVDTLAAEHEVPAFTDLTELLSAVDPDVVSVTTPEHHHVEPAVTALEAGADVFCEKIMADSMDGGRRLVAAAEETGRTLGVNYNYRHMPSFAGIESAIGDGGLGEVSLASADVHAYGWHHVLDLCRFLFGEPESVRASLDHEPSVVAERFRFDEFLYVPSHGVAATFEFEDGTIASVSSSIHTELDDHLIDLAVYGEAGRVRLTGMAPDDSSGTVAPGPVADALRSTESITLSESFERSLHAFLDAIRDGQRPPTTGEDGLRLLELERAVVRAAERDERIQL